MSYGKTENGKWVKRALLVGTVMVTIVLIADLAQQSNIHGMDGGRQGEDSSFSNHSPGRADSISKNPGRSRVTNDASAAEKKEKPERPVVLFPGSNLIRLEPAFIARYGLDDKQVQETVNYLTQVTRFVHLFPPPSWNKLANTC